jgi:hypothetical protein
MFGQTPSSLLEIRDWSIARELDITAARLLHDEETNREIERENRDRKFWITILGPLCGVTESDGPEMSDSAQIFKTGEGIKFAMPKQRGSSRTDPSQGDMRDIQPKRPHG